MKRIFIRVAVNTLIGLSLIFVWSRFVNLGLIWQTITKARFEYLIGILVLLLFSALLRAWRLRLILKKVKIGVVEVIKVNFLSQFLSFLIPIRAGEIAKSVYLSTEYELSFAKTVIWILADRFLDFWVVLFLISTLLPFLIINLPPQLIKVIVLIFFILTILAILVVKSSQIMRKIIHSAIKLFINKSSFLGKKIHQLKVDIKLLNLVDSLIEGLAVLDRPLGEVLILLGLTVLATFSDAIMWLVSLKSVGVNITPGAVVLGNSLTALTFLIPAAPGYVGSAEAAGLAIFSGILGFGVNQVSAATLLYHILTIIFLLGAGITSLYLLKFDLKLVWKKVRGKS